MSAFKRIISFVLSLAIIFLGVYNKKAKANSVYSDLSSIIIIDAGHGGFDAGASANDGTLEKNINLEIATALNDILVVYGYNTLLTRTDDNALSVDKSSNTTKQQDLECRVDFTKKYPNSIFISIHQNKFEMPSVHGFQTFYSKNHSNSKLLAECIQGSAKKIVQPDNERPVKEDTRKVYIMEKIMVPAVIVECGFLSNAEELAKLKSESYRMLLAYSVADGILMYLKENKDKGS